MRKNSPQIDHFVTEFSAKEFAIVHAQTNGFSRPQVGAIITALGARTNLLKEQCARAVGEFEGLMEHSRGVAGFHRNDEVAPWEDLVSGGQFERLSSLSQLKVLIDFMSSTRENEHSKDATIDFPEVNKSWVQAQFDVDTKSIATAHLALVEMGMSSERACETLQAFLSQQDHLMPLAKAFVDEFDCLISESAGVSGLHLNGDLAPWAEILEGGRYAWVGEVAQLNRCIDQLASDGYDVISTLRTFVSNNQDEVKQGIPRDNNLELNSDEPNLLFQHGPVRKSSLSF